MVSSLSAVLALSGGLLQKFVGNLKHRLFVANNKSQAIAIREVAFVMRRKTAGSGAIGEVVEYGRIEVAVGKGAFRTDSESVLTPALLHHQVAVRGAEAAAGATNLP